MWSGRDEQYASRIQKSKGIKVFKFYFSPEIDTLILTSKNTQPKLVTHLEYQLLEVML
jgi:hypothetical protein